MRGCIQWRHHEIHAKLASTQKVHSLVFVIFYFLHSSRYCLFEYVVRVPIISIVDVSGAVLHQETTGSLKVSFFVQVFSEIPTSFGLSQNIMLPLHNFLISLNFRLR